VGVLTEDIKKENGTINQQSSPNASSKAVPKAPSSPISEEPNVEIISEPQPPLEPALQTTPKQNPQPKINPFPEIKEEDPDIIDLTSVKEKFKSFFKSTKPEKKLINEKIKPETINNEVAENYEKYKINPFPEKKLETENKEESDTVDLSIIKNKLKSFFNHEKKAEVETEHKPKDKNDSIDIKNILDFTKKNSKWLIPVLFIFIAIFISSFFRMMPSDLPITDNWAEDSIKNAYKNQIEAQINNEYPNLPQQNRDTLIDQEINKLISGNKQEYERNLRAVSQQYKSRLQDENGDTYLLAIDPYLWFSQARNVINNGHLGDKKVDGQSYFTLRDGRLDKKSSVQLNPYFGAYLFKFLRIFNEDISLMRAVFLLPVIIIGLSIIPTFLIGRRLAGNVGGLFAAIFLATNGALLSRTPGGFSDTDPYHILFPATIIWLFFEAYMAKTEKPRLIYSAIAGLFVGLYSAAWSGWSFAFLIVIVVIFITIGIDIIKLFRKDTGIKKLIKSKIYLFFAFILSSGIFVSLFQSFNHFWKDFTRPIRFISLKAVGVKSIWPNVLTTVAEFNTQSFSNIISQAGGNLIFFGGLMGIILLLVNKNKKDNFNIFYITTSAIYYAVMIGLKENLNNPLTFIIVVAIPVLVGFLKILYRKEKIPLVYAILILIWFCSTAYAYTKGIRFALLMVPAFSIALGTTFGIIYEKVSFWLTKGIKVNKNVSKILIFVILTLFLIAPFTQASNISRYEIPSMNDAWFNALTNIKEDAEQAIITSWWDFGHWFVAIAERMVTFDGGDQGERIHWVGRSLRTDDEAEAIGILRMLNCAQERAPHKLDEFTEDSLRSIKILYEIFPISNRDLAMKKYQELGLNSDQAKEMIEYTHCEDLIDNYYITSEDMVGKSGVWGHFGSWDFTKASIYQNIRKLSRDEAILYLKDNFKMEELEADKTYTSVKTEDADRWIAPWPGYLSGVRSCDRISEDTIHCSTSIQGQSITLVVSVNSLNVKIGNTNLTPNSIVYATPEGVKEKEFDGEKAGFSIVLIPDDGGYDFILADHLQASGMFTRMFFLDGHGLKCFSKFDEKQQINGQRIVTWKIDFSCQQDNLVYFNSEPSVEDIVE
jgi:dolichyl-phosphooligosaccharide-protein glycotransferase